VGAVALIRPRLDDDEACARFDRRADLDVERAVIVPVDASLELPGPDPE